MPSFDRTHDARIRAAAFEWLVTSEGGICWRGPRNVRGDLHILRQLELLDPHLVLSCGSPAVAGSLTWLYQLDWKFHAESESRWAEADGMVVVDLIHPSARGPHPANQFERLVELRNVILSKMPEDSLL